MSFRGRFLIIVAGISCLTRWSSHAQQTPFVDRDWSPKARGAAILHEDADPLVWDVNVPLSANTTGRYIFDTASSLLQHWPNTRYPNGHTVIPGTIAPGTLLYHGATREQIPAVPEWTATDPEHAHVFCWGTKETGCWQLTLVATRPLKVLYFDGTSAAKMNDGVYDLQDLMIAGEVLDHKKFSMEDERNRLSALCEWGERFEIDGFVRMEPDFEVMLCNFTSGVTTLSFLKITPDVSLWPFSYPSRQLDLQSPRGRDKHESIFAGHQHNHYPGETRISLDYSRLVSLYDLTLAPSLAAVRAGQERRLHRLSGIAGDDVRATLLALEDVLSRPESGSGVDWPTLLRVIFQRFADRLPLIQQALNSPKARFDLSATAHKVQAQLRVILNPYLLHSASPPSSNKTAGLSFGAWAAGVFKLCATSHTAFLATPQFEDRLTREERVLRDAAEEVTTEICRVITRMWATGVIEGADEELGSGNLVNALALFRRWKGDIDDLTGWLDWSVWVKCQPACSDEEECYLPTWPFWRKDIEHERERMKPRCIRRIEPFPDIFP